jgi:hypothetical protein
MLPHPLSVRCSEVTGRRGTRASEDRPEVGRALLDRDRREKSTCERSEEISTEGGVMIVRIVFWARKDIS